MTIPSGRIVEWIDNERCVRIVVLLSSAKLGQRNAPSCRSWAERYDCLGVIIPAPIGAGISA
jgi:hypothetical protein